MSSPWRQREKHIRNMLYARRYGLPACKKVAQQELDRLGISIRIRKLAEMGQHNDA